MTAFPYHGLGSKRRLVSGVLSAVYVLVPVLVAGGKVFEYQGKVCHAHGNFLLHEGVGDTPGEIAFACACLAP